MDAHVLITGNSSGIGRAFTEQYLARGAQVYGLSRRGFGGQHARLHDIRCDLGRLELIPTALDALLDGVTRLDLVLLNAGILGEIRELHQTSMESIERVMAINVWANKVLLDWLIAQRIEVGQIVLISSGAAVVGGKGWGAYSLSKATLNMLTQLYAHEFPNSHLSAVAPGLVDTAMQDYLCDEKTVDGERYPSLQRLRAARGSDAMPQPGDAAARIIGQLERIRREMPSGAFVDIRDL